MTPEPIQEWFNRQRAETPDEMFYKEASGSQIIFARDELRYLASAGLEYEQSMRVVTVISEHRSKSVKLPVYSFDRPDIGLKLVARCNFHDWKLSVISEKPVDVDLSGLCHTTPPIDPKYSGDYLSPVYFEGFPRELVFGYYAQSDKKTWSVCLDGGHQSIWTAVFLIMRAVGAVKPLKWSVSK